jgi:hypothetical protein
LYKIDRQKSFYVFASIINMVDGITLHSAHNPESPPDHVMQIAEMVRFLLNKYVPTSSLDDIETDLLLSLNDFHH